MVQKYNSGYLNKRGPIYFSKHLKFHLEKLPEANIFFILNKEDNDPCTNVVFMCKNLRCSVEISIDKEETSLARLYLYTIKEFPLKKPVVIQYMDSLVVLTSSNIRYTHIHL